MEWLRRGEHFYPELFNREDQGERMLARAQEKVSEILNTHEPEIPSSVVEAVQRYVAKKRAGLSKA
jgi:hypothetical protein